MNAALAYDQPADGVATVVITLEVKEGRDADYEAWQGRMNELVKGQPGFVGTEVIRPVADLRREWAVIYRFDTAEHLRQWLHCPQRRGLLEIGKDLLVQPAQQTTMAGGPTTRLGVTLVVRHRVKRGREEAFKRIIGRMQAAERGCEGCRGAELLPPVSGVQEEWTSLVSFDTSEHLDAWLESSERIALTRELEQAVEGFNLHTVGSSFGSWFSFDMADGKATPNWKQAMVVQLVLYPTVMALTLWFTPWLDREATPLWLGMFVSNVLSVAVLTWILMPLATRALQVWLRPDATPAQTLVGFALVTSLYVVSLLAFSHL